MSENIITEGINHRTNSVNPSGNVFNDVMVKMINKLKERRAQEVNKAQENIS